MDKPDCPVTLGKPFLASAKAQINIEYKEIVLSSRVKYLIHHISHVNIRRDVGTECHTVEDVDSYNSQS